MRNCIRRRLAGIAIAALGTAVVGCGSSSPGLTRAQLATKLNSICTEATQAAAKLGSFNDISQLHSALKQLIPIAVRADKQVASLKADAAVSADLNAYKAALGANLAEVRAIEQKTAAPGADVQSLLAKNAAASARTHAAAAKLGATKCLR